MGTIDIPYTQDLTDCFAGEIGDGGLETAIFDHYVGLSEGALERIRAAHDGGLLPLLDLPQQREDLADIGHAP